MTAVLDIADLHVYFPVRTPWGRTQAVVQALRGVDLSLEKGETVGLVGESGCGKSTLARAVVRLVEPTKGTIQVNGVEWSGKSLRKLRPLRPQVQMVFQDPYSSLNPRMRVGAILEEPLTVHRRGDRTQRRAMVAELLDRVGLHPNDIDKYPHEFSGGQRQRIGIARAIALQPDVLLADEAVSALDVSIQAQILNLLRDLQQEHGHSMLFISHDLRVVQRISDRVMVMYLGRIVESGAPREVFSAPRHPYTRALLDAVPDVTQLGRKTTLKLQGEPPSPANPPSGCAFRTRCPRASQTCTDLDPMLDAQKHSVACHHPLSD